MGPSSFLRDEFYRLRSEPLVEGLTLWGHINIICPPTPSPWLWLVVPPLLPWDTPFLNDSSRSPHPSLERSRRTNIGLMPAHRRSHSPWVRRGFLSPRKGWLIMAPHPFLERVTHHGPPSPWLPLPLVHVTDWSAPSPCVHRGSPSPWKGWLILEWWMGVRTSITLLWLDGSKY